MLLNKKYCFLRKVTLVFGVSLQVFLVETNYIWHMDWHRLTL